MPAPNHDLLDFIEQMSNELADEYLRIQKRVKDDPGTAGDQGEENWADLLRKWLPADHTVVTKGRIIGKEGIASPQVDVLVLRPTYPPFLRNKKVYLATGVAAAFECKITLEAKHIPKAFENSVAIRRLLPHRNGSPYRELTSPIVYELLAHSHSWTQENSTPLSNILTNVHRADLEHVQHPRESLDLVCVADLATIVLAKIPGMGLPGRGTPAPLALATGYYQLIKDIFRESEWEKGPARWSERPVRPVGRFLSCLWQMMAWENAALRPLADYFRLMGAGASSGELRYWDLGVYSIETRARVTRYLSEGGWAMVGEWDEWSREFIDLVHQ